MTPPAVQQTLAVAAFPTTAEAITPVWLSSVLGTSVRSVEVSAVGTGQMGDSARLSLVYDDPAAPLPATMVVKLPAADPTSRATAVAGRSYEIEVRFYQQLAPHLPVRTARLFHADVEPGTADFVLVLEDLAPARQGDQLAGCSVDQAALAVTEVAKLHAPRWGDPGLAGIEWLDRRHARRALDPLTLMPQLWIGFTDRYGDALDPEVIEVGERFIARLATWYDRRPEPWSIVHNDYRLDNLLFGDHAGGPPIAVVDWQTTSHGPPVADVSYFVGAGLLPDQRRRHELDLVRAYHQAVTAAGVQGWSWDRCWEDYRRYAYAGLHMAVLASMIVERTPRGDEMFLAMAHRHARQVVDLASEDLLL